jgi:hypothetical protein
VVLSGGMGGFGIPSVSSIGSSYLLIYYKRVAYVNFDDMGIVG